jgi:hypothetical protein
MGKQEIQTKFLLEKLEGRHHVGDLNIDKGKETLWNLSAVTLHQLPAFLNNARQVTPVWLLF